MPVAIRLAVPADVPALKELIAGSARSLSGGCYTPAQTEAAIRFVFGVDSQLIADGTYYVVVEDGAIVACGGWSRRRTLYGGDQRPMGAEEALDTAVEAARIRAFFVAGSHARRGLGTRLLRACAEAASVAGFTRLELMSTLPGVPFYAKLGFVEVRRITDTLPDGTSVDFVLMRRDAMPANPRITPCLWFDDQAEEAAAFYTSVFPNSKIVSVSRFGEVGREFHGKTPGTAMTVAFELDGQAFTALNGGPVFKFNEAISFQVRCTTQVELDHYWDDLSAGGDAKAQQCGWLKDKYGVSWQVIPGIVAELMSNPSTSERAMTAMLKMKKIDIAELERACAGSR